MLVYFAAGDGRSPVTIMTVAIFVLAILVMARQSVILRDDAKARQREAVDLVEARFASLIRNASDVIMIVDADGRIEYASPAVQRTFGLWHDDLVGRRLGEIWREADRDRIAAFLAEVTATQGIPIGPVEVSVGTSSRRFILECVGSNLLDDPAVKGLALNLRDVTERKALEDQLRQLAFHDPLTLLANRSLFRNRVEHALALSRRTQDRLAVLMIDLDNFKNVNDSLGHDAGDRLLQTAAQRLVKCTRAADTVARLGGDEFAVLLEGVIDGRAGRADRRVGHRGLPHAAHDRRQRPARDDQRRRRPVGARQRHGARAPQRRHRDVQREVRGQGPARRVPRAACRSSSASGSASRTTCTQALVRNEFFLEFQPIIDLKTTELLGVEALVRWQHPEQGRLLPGQFIPMAEETGQIIALGRWVLDDACCRVQEWRKSVAAGAGLRVAVNISGRHLQQGDLVGGRAPRARRLGPRAGEPAHRAHREHDDAQFRGQPVRLKELKALGVRLAIDDFGTGYSSLSYLHRFPIDILKIDRSFVSRLTESAEGPKLARAVVMLGETLGLETVAEGVEVEDQVTQLLQLGCVAAQGFLFSHATSLDVVAASSFALQREQLRVAHSGYDNLTATGRYRIADMVRQRTGERCPARREGLIRPLHPLPALGTPALEPPTDSVTSSAPPIAADVPVPQPVGVRPDPSGDGRVRDDDVAGDPPEERGADAITTGKRAMIRAS